MPKAGNTPPGFPVGNKTSARGRNIPPQDRDDSPPKSGDNPPGVDGYPVGGRSE